MKTLSKFSATIILLALTALAACEKRGGNGGGGTKGEYPPVEVTGKVEGAIAAGKAGAIEITGVGFDPDQDYVYVGWAGEEGLDYERVSKEVLTLTKSRISFGVNVGASYVRSTVKVYLDREGYERMPLSGDITFTLPTVAEGYIPDPYFRATLNRPKENPWCKEAFDAYGMMNPSVAAKVTVLELDGCEALSLEGLELFTSATFIKAWDMKKIVTLDLSKLPMKGIDFRCERALKLEKLVTPPWAYTFLVFDCPKLARVDASGSPWLKRLEITEQWKDKVSTVKDLDIRKNQTGNHRDTPTREDEFATWGGDSHFNVGEGATIKIDSWFLVDHSYNAKGGPWTTLYNSWKRGAKIEVYSRVDPHRDQLLGTVPMYSEDPEALAEKPGEDGKMVNKWSVEDPNVAPGR